MSTHVLNDTLLLLAVAVFTVALFRRIHLPPILGYLFVGVMLGPHALGLLQESEGVHFLAEFGVVFLLFTIGLEFSLPKMIAMRGAVLGLGGAQVVITAVIVAIIALSIGTTGPSAFVLGGVAALSSTAIVVKQLVEQIELNQAHGTTALSILLFQDLAAIPFLVIIPVLAGEAGQSVWIPLVWAMLKATLVFGLIMAVGYWLLRPLFHEIARARSAELFTLAVLLVSLAAAWATHAAGLSLALGAFLAGMMLGETEYRHQIEADIASFEGLLLAVFFMAVGMSIDLSVLVARPVALVLIVALLIAVKFAVLYGLGSWWGLKSAPARRLAIVLSQGGEFAFVLFSVGLFEGVIGRDVASLLTLAVTLSMAATPLLLLADDMFIRMRTSTVPDYEMPPEAEQHVIIAGFGRFGQIVARVLRARHIPFTALDTSSAQVDFVKRYGATIYFGDAGRIDILRAAGAEKATSFVLAIRDVEDSLRIAEMVRKNFPDLPIYARARDRTHVHKLMDLGVTIIEREMFLAALDLTGKLLRGLGLKPKEAKTLIETFKRHDQERLFNEYEDYTDEEKMRANALTAAVELQELFARDIEALEDGSSSDETSDGRGSTG